MFFDGHIYPSIWDVLFFLGIIVLCVLTGRWDTLVIVTVFTCIFGRGYYKAIKETAKIFDRTSV